MVVTGACGRIDFDALQARDARAGSADATSDTNTDGTALTCAAMPPVCGDGCCDGNNGELCSTCTTDCMTTNPVCGNGACDPGEDSTTCYADCGPSPWPWTADEMSVVTLLNQARTGGTACPGSGTSTAPALTANASLTAGARINTWEIAHESFFSSNGAVCNGRSFAQLQTEFGFVAQAAVIDATSSSAAVNTWMANSTLCPILMDPSFTLVGAAVAHDAHSAFMVRLK